MALGHDLYPFILTFVFCTLHFAFIKLCVFVPARVNLHHSGLFTSLPPR